MSEVTLQVGGRAYTVSCADGEEAHVRRLASIVDGKLTAMGGSIAPGDAKNLLFAALILADEVDEARRSADPAKIGNEGSALAENVTRGLEALADRLESVAYALESGGITT
jgi:cell division protein ZapA